MAKYGVYTCGIRIYVHPKIGLCPRFKELAYFCLEAMEMDCGYRRALIEKLKEDIRG